MFKQQQNLGRNSGASEMPLSLQRLLLLLIKGNGSVVVDLLSIEASIVCVGFVFGPLCYAHFAVLSVLSSFAIMSLGDRELVALLYCFSLCHLTVSVL